MRLLTIIGLLLLALSAGAQTPLTLPAPLPVNPSTRQIATSYNALLKAVGAISTEAYAAGVLATTARADATLAFNLATEALAATHGTPYANSRSPLGIGLTGPGGEEMPFLNYLKTANQWVTRTPSNADTNEEVFAYANCLDVNGYPQHLPCQATGIFSATFNGTTTMVVNSLTSGAVPWLGGTLNVTGSPTITACPGGVCGGTGSYTLSGAVATATTSVTESATFTQINVGLFGTSITNAPYYPSGNGSWLLIYDGDDNAGSTNFEYHDDASLASHSCSGGTCTDTLNISGVGGSFRIFMNSTDTGSTGRYVKNMRVVQTAQYNALSAVDKAAFNACCTAGSTVGIYFNPDWLALIKNFRSLRFMDWNNTNSNANILWSTRLPVGYVFWRDGIKYNGDVPIEVRVALVNKLHAHAWENIPCLADDNFKTQDATLWLTLLSPDLNIKVETCNEAWNHNFTGPGGTIILNGLTNDQSVFTSCGMGFPCLLDNYIYRTVRTGILWTTVWTGNNSSRLTPIMGGQFGNSSPGATNDYELGLTTATDGCCGVGVAWSGTAATHVKALATAPYYPCCFINFLPLAWTADADAGQRRFYNNMVAGGDVPGTLVTGTCGNGAGKTCNPVDNDHFTLTTGLSLPATPANGTCVAATTTNAGTSSANQLAVDSGTSLQILGADGTVLALSNTTSYVFCFTNGIASVATGASLGAGGSGGTTGGQVVTLVGGNCVIAPTFNVTIASGAIQASGITVNKPGLCPTTPANPAGVSGAGLSGATLNVTYPSVTTGWYAQNFTGHAGCTYEFQCIAQALAQDYTLAVTTYGLVGIFGYEGSLNLLDYCLFGSSFCGTSGANKVEDALFLALQTSPYLYQLQHAWLDLLRQQGLTEQHFFTDPSTWNFGNATGSNFVSMWAFSPGVYSASNPTVRKQQLDDYIKNTPCWWAGC